MPYAPTVPVQAVPQPAPVVVVAENVVNRRTRGGEDANWVGTIRGGYGNPLKVLNSPEPLTRVVGRAFTDALTVRGLTRPGTSPRYTLTVTIHELSSNQLIRREAIADFAITLTDRVTGREVWADRESFRSVDGNPFATGVLASEEELRQVTVRTMNQVIDQLLDKQGFRNSLRT